MLFFKLEHKVKIKIKNQNKNKKGVFSDSLCTKNYKISLHKFLCAKIHLLLEVNAKILMLEDRA